MNTQTQTKTVMRYLGQHGKGIVRLAREKSNDTSIFYGRMTDRDLAFQIALCYEVARTAVSLSLNTLDKTDWKTIAETVNA